MIAAAMDRAWRRNNGLALSADTLAAVLLVLLTLATRLIYFGDPVSDHDEQLYSLIGQHMLAGNLPYVDVWDRKPVGLFLLFAFAHALGGSGALAYQLLAALFACAGTWLTYLLARGLADGPTAAAGAALYPVLMAIYGGQSGQSEIFHVPLVLAMLLLLRDPGHPKAAMRACGAMLIGGLALQVKYTVLPQCLFFGGIALFGEWRRGAVPGRLARRAAIFAALGLAPTILAALAYASLGEFRAFFFANFESFFQRQSLPGGRLRTDLLPYLLPLLVLIGGGLAAAFTFRPPRDWRGYGLYCGFLIATLASVLLPGTVYLYYFAALVPAAILVAMPLLDRRGPLSIVPATLLVTATCYLFFPVQRYQAAREERAAVSHLARELQPYVGADGHCLYVYDGPAALYSLTGSCLPTRFVYPDHLNNAFERGALGISQDGEVARILAARPGAIVTAGPALTPQNPLSAARVRAALARDYRRLAVTEVHGRTVTAWVRRDRPLPAPTA